MAYPLGANAQNQMAGASAAIPREPTAAESIQATLTTLTERSHSLRRRLGDLRDRAIGSEPTATGKDAPRPVPNGSLQSLQIAAQDICQIIEDCHGIAGRLDRIA